MGYGTLNFPTYADLRPRNDEPHEPDDATLKAAIYTEGRPLFDMIAKLVGQYVASGQQKKLRVFFAMMEEALNMALDEVENASKRVENENVQCFQWYRGASILFKWTSLTECGPFFLAKLRIFFKKF